MHSLIFLFLEDARLIEWLLVHPVCPWSTWSSSHNISQSPLQLTRHLGCLLLGDLLTVHVRWVIRTILKTERVMYPEQDSPEWKA